MTTTSAKKKATSAKDVMIFDSLIADLGDPVIRPAIDRSFDTLSRMSEMERAKGKNAKKPEPRAS